jgi:hypothetical protein
MKRNLFRFLAVATIAVSLLAHGTLSAAHLTGRTLFGITWFSNELIAIDPATGEGRLIGSLGEAAFSYGIAARSGKLYTFDQVTNRIREINPVTGEFSTTIDVGLSGLQGEGDLTFRSDGVGFLVSNLNANAQPVNDLYTFDVTTGTSQRIGSVNVAIDALAFDSAGTLYALGQGDATLYTINTTTAAATAVGALGVDMNSPIAGMAFAPAAPDGTEDIYASIDDRLHLINKNTGAATPVSADVLDFGFGSVSGLVFAPGAASLGNLSTRVAVGTGENVGIGGFIVRGAAAKKVIVRGIGPSLSNVPGVLADPVIELFNAQGISIARNDNWRENQQAEVAASGLQPMNDKESAIVRDLVDGSYTAVLSGANNTTGVGLVEIYDFDLGNGSKLANLSTRGFAQADPNVLIGGVIVSGSASQRVVLRAIGPTLAGSNVQTPLQDPTLELFDANGTSIAINDNWRSDQESEITAAMLAPGDDRESAIVRDLTPAAYTAIVRGAGSATGVALVEIYNVSANSQP